MLTKKDVLLSKAGIDLLGDAMLHAIRSEDCSSLMKSFVKDQLAQLETDPNSLIGRKMRGFECISVPNMYTGLVGVVEEYFPNVDSPHYSVRFPNGMDWYYPASEVPKHLVDDPAFTFTTADGITTTNRFKDIWLINWTEYGPQPVILQARFCTANIPYFSTKEAAQKALGQPILTTTSGKIIYSKDEYVCYIDKDGCIISDKAENTPVGIPVFSDQIEAEAYREKHLVDKPTFTFTTADGVEIYDCATDVFRANIRTVILHSASYAQDHPDLGPYFSTKEAAQSYLNSLIIGYEAPMDLFGGFIKKGDVVAKSIASDYYMKRISQQILKGNPLPSEIVETWKPVYRNTKIK